MERYHAVKVHCDIDIEKLEGAVELKAEDQMKVAVPMKRDGLSALVEMESRVQSPNAEAFSIVIKSEALFSFSERVDNEEQIICEQGYQQIKKRVLEIIRDVTAAMGIPPVDLTNAGEISEK